MIRTGLAILLGIGLLTAMLGARPEKGQENKQEKGQENQPATSGALAGEMKAFAATWEIVAVKPEGVTKSAKRLVFHANGSYAALDQEGKELWAGTFEIDPASSPKIWDHRSHESQKKQGDVLGIYKREGDKLTACCVVGKWTRTADMKKEWSGKPRPTEFKLDGADVLLELKRVKSEAK